MKGAFAFLMLSAAIASAQVKPLRGVVKIQSSGNIPIKGVQIRFTKSNPTESKEKGIFLLQLQRAAVGDRIVPLEISKYGYEPVNLEDLQNTHVSADPNYLITVVMCRQGALEVARRKYYNISIKSFQNEYDAKIRELENKLSASLISQERYRLEAEKLDEQLKNSAEQSKLMADNLSRIDRDNAPTYYLKALDYFDKNKVDSAIAILTTINIGRELKTTSDYRESLKKELAKTDKKIEELIKSAKLKAQLFSTQYQTDSAAVYYKLAITADSLRAHPHEDLAAFYFNNSRYSEALDQYSKALQIELKLGQFPFCIARIERMIGNCLKEQKKEALAFTHFEKAKMECKRLSGKDSLACVYNLYSNLSEGYLRMNYDSAAYYAIRCIELNEKFYTDDPDFLEDLADNYSILAICNFNDDDFKQALSYSYLQLQTLEALPPTGKGNFQFEFAACYNLLADTYLELDELDSARRYVQKSRAIFERLNTERKGALGDVLIDTYSTYDRLYTKLSMDDSSIVYLNKTLEILNSRRFPEESVFETRIQTYENLGVTYHHINEYRKAINFSLLAMDAASKLDIDTRLRIEIATAPRTIGQSYLGLEMYDSAETYLDLARTYLQRPAHLSNQLLLTSDRLDEWEELIAGYGKLVGHSQTAIPKITQFLFGSVEDVKRYNFNSKDTLKPALASYYDNVATLFSKCGKKDSALVYVDKGLAIYRALFDKITADPELFTEFLNTQDRSLHYLFSLGRTSDAIDRAKEIVNLSARYLQNDPVTRDKITVGAFHDLSFHELFVRDYPSAIKYSLACLELNPQYDHVNANLALGYLLNDQYDLAEKIYLQYHNKQYDEDRTWDTVFLKDIANLQAAGIYHRDMKKIKTLLKKEARF